MPTARDSESGTWLKTNPPSAARLYEDGANAPEELTWLRDQLPLNGETAFADTAAAFAALPKEEQAKLEGVYLHRRKYPAGDEGYLAPLVRQNPRTGVKAFHSPCWGNRVKGQGIPPITVVGMSLEESRGFLERLEAHVLQPRFRYDHPHTPGDVTIWSNLALLHCSPSVKIGIGSLEDARLFYRLSAKGPPALTLPRTDDQSWIDANVVPPYRTPPEIMNVCG